jgi:hypothetical protein
MTSSFVVLLVHVIHRDHLNYQVFLDEIRNSDVLGLTLKGRKL